MIKFVGTNIVCIVGERVLVEPSVNVMLDPTCPMIVKEFRDNEIKIMGRCELSRPGSASYKLAKNGQVTFEAGTVSLTEFEKTGKMPLNYKLKLMQILKAIDNYEGSIFSNVWKDYGVTKEEVDQICEDYMDHLIREKKNGD